MKYTKLTEAEHTSVICMSWLGNEIFYRNELHQLKAAVMS